METIKVFRGTSFKNDEGRYYTDSEAVAKTYVGWRGEFEGNVVACEISPSKVFDANKDIKIACEIAEQNGWDAFYLNRALDLYYNKPNNAFVGLIHAAHWAAKDIGIETTNEQDENTVIEVLKALGYDFIKQCEIGGGRYPDGTFQMPKKKHVTWVKI